jgi:hypothetical protein
LSSSETSTDDLLDRLVLEIDAIALLYGSDAELRERLGAKLTESHDEGVRRFVKALQSETRIETGRLLAIAIGELVMASLLVVAGTIVLVPTVAGVNTLQGLVQYLAQRAGSGAVGSPLSQYVSLAEFAIGVVLVLSAFFALREAATKLKEVGLAVKSGET